MTRCDYDGVFYRVFCVTLLAIAFTFTVVLTNVFVDIDGLLAGQRTDKKNEKPQHQELKEDKNHIRAPVAANGQNNVFYPTVDKLETQIPEVIYNDMKGFEDDSEDVAAYRKKRSLDSSDYRFHIKDSKIKKMLTSRLAELLEEIDGEDSDTKVENNKEKGEKLDETPKGQVETIEVKKRGSIKETIEGTKNDLLHLAMYNILLQGIIGHMDLNEMYRKINSLGQHFDQNVNKGEIEEAKLNIKAPKLLIKTVIDIISLDKDINKENDTNSKENVKGVIKLIYNGKSVKLNQIDDKDDFKENNHKPEEKAQDTHSTLDTKKQSKVFIEVDELSNIIKDNIEKSHISDSILYDAVLEYFNTHLKAVEKYKNKRLKRNVKVRGAQETTTQKAKAHVKHGKTDEEELYVEIETHFDGKGIKGEKKRKLVRNIIDKIQKAIHTDIGNLKEASKKPRRFHVKKRFQNPLDASNDRNVLLNKFLIPMDAVIHRELNPISKTYAPAVGAPNVGDKSGDAWKRTYIGPHFLSAAKAINSAEMGEIDVNFKEDVISDGISQRLQKPLNSEIQDIDAASFYQLGNLKFYIKEIDGTGFSIGFNQYLGEPPDEDSIKTFTGIDKLMKTYQNAKGETQIPQINELTDSEEYYNISKREARNRKRRHTIVRRAIDNGSDYHSNEYKVIFNNNFLPYDSYQEIIEDRNKKVHLSLSRQPKVNNDNSNITVLDAIHGFALKDLPFIVDANIFEKDLRPSEIFGLANMLERNKRSMKVQRYSKVKTKSRLNRYINTAPKRLFLKNKQLRRSKRQIDNIRIFTSENLPVPRQSNENIFVVSNENIFADPSLIREVDVPDNTDQFEQNAEETYGYIDPFISPRQSPYISSIFGPRSRHNPLMSKYPHIFMDEISRSKEDVMPENSFLFNNYVNSVIPNVQNLAQQDFPIIPSTTEQPSTINDNYNYNVPRVKELVEAISPRTNYKLTVKILPKNMSSLPSGFKEVHTSINKSLSKNGLLFSSLVNVSTIIKVEKLVVNKSNSDIDTESPPVAQDTNKEMAESPLVKLIKKHHEKMKNLLRQHKQKIDAQLDHLNQEKATIETIIFDKAVDKNDPQKKPPDDMIDVLLPSDPPQLLHLTKNEAGQLISSALMKLHEVPNVNSSPTTTVAPKITVSKRETQPTYVKEPVTTESTTTESTTTETTRPTTSDPDKMRIIKTIQHNENLTNTILTKIDRNTEILQRFLQKFTDRIDQRNPPSQSQMSRRNEEEQSKIREAMEVPMFYQPNWKENPFLKQNMPDLEVIKNDTSISIPFVYAYQQPYPLKNNVKPNNPVASVVYQGHIHTNAVRKPNYSNNNNNNSNINTNSNNKENVIPINQTKTKFFLDNLGDDYKLNEYKLRHKQSNSKPTTTK